MFKVPKNLLRWIGTLTTTGLVIFLLFQVGWSEITDAIRHLSLSSVVLAFSGILFSRIFIGLRWWFLLPLKKEEGKSLGFWHAAQLHFTGLFANNFLPSTIGGDVVKWVGVKAWGISGTEGAAAVIMDRLIGVLGDGVDGSLWWMDVFEYYRTGINNGRLAGKYECWRNKLPSTNNEENN